MSPAGSALSSGCFVCGYYTTAPWAYPRGFRSGGKAERAGRGEVDGVSLLHSDEVTRRLEALPGWHHRGNAIEKHFDRGDFNGSMRFVNAIAELANAQDHHPDMTISWNDVTLTLTSHDLSGLTERDFRLAEAIERLATG